MINKFKGTGVAIITPFHKDGSIDFQSLENLIEFQITNNINYIVVLGTTGESATLSKDEKNAVINFAVEIIQKRVPIVVGIGGNNTNDVVYTIKNTNLEEVDAILSVCPYYNKPQQNGFYAHFKAIANASPLPVILYNVPGRTGSNMKAETTLKLANDFKNIIAIKEASGNFEQIMHIIKDRPSDFLVISGDDALTLPLIAAGADGVISVVANAFPADFSKMVQLCLKQDFKNALPLHYKLLDIIESMFVEGSPAGVKAYLEIMGKCQNTFRLPMISVGKKTYNNIQSLLQNYK